MSEIRLADSMSAADRWAAIDYGEGDGPSVNALGIDMRWPEPGECCADVLATAQLYWPDPCLTLTYR